MYQVVWIRVLKLFFGSTSFSVSLMLTSLIFGFALGSYLFRKKADSYARPVFLFFIIELVIGIYGVFIISFFNILPFTIFSLLIPFRYVVIFLLLLTPSVLLGALWPVVHKLYVENVGEIGKDAGTLYFGNSMGSALGAFSSGFLLIPIFGVTATSLFASFINILIAVSFLSIRGRFGK